jgi:hypothetical protein
MEFAEWYKSTYFVFCPEILNSEFNPNIFILCTETYNLILRYRCLPVEEERNVMKFIGPWNVVLDSETLFIFLNIKFQKFLFTAVSCKHLQEK